MSLVLPNKQPNLSTVMFRSSTRLTVLLSISLLFSFCLPSSSSSYLLHSANALVLIFMIVNEARRYPGINIVSFDWLRTSIDSHVRADEAQFSLRETDSSGLAPSKQKETKGKGSIEDDSSDVEDHEVHVAAKKHKDVQTATSRSLLIPADETCKLAGKTRDRKPFRC